jgi:hypothetical protein
MESGVGPRPPSARRLSMADARTSNFAVLSSVGRTEQSHDSK